MSNGSQSFGAENSERPKGRRWWLTALRALAVAVVLGGGAVGAWLYASLWQPSGTIRVSGIDGAANIVYDSRGIPHISADNATSGAFALGFVHARDRLWQMEMQRRAATGRLSEIFGSSTLATDRFMRSLDFAGQVERTHAGLGDDTKAMLAAYAAGVNAWLDRPLAVLPPEFGLLLHRPEPWRPTDSLLWGKLMTLQLGLNWRTELLRARLATKLTPEEMADLWPSEAKPAPAPLEGVAEMGPLFDRLLAALPAPLAASAAGQASNGWLVAPAHSASGKPLLANDPHLGFSAPIVWYLAVVKTPAGTLTGATAPGIPFHVLGHNGTVAWGMTNTGSDTQDLFVEQLVEGDPDRYQTPDGAEPFAIRLERIRVRGGADQVLRVRTSRHGPVISDLVEFPETAAGKDKVIALQAATLAENDRTAQALLRINRAADWPSFREALRDFHGPQQNVFYADASGTIALMAPARIPIRKSGRGNVPQPGWSGEFDWTGWVPFEELPQVVNPPGGRIANANNRIVGPDYPHYLTDDWPADYRARRIWEMLAQAPLQNADTAVRIQMDVEDIAARELLPLMLNFEPSTAAARKVALVLKHWNHDALARRAEPLLFETWMREFNRVLLTHRLGTLFDFHWGTHPRFIRRVLSDTPQWCDDPATPEVETCPTMLDRSLNQAIDMLTAEFGANPLRWRWGNAHRARFPHVLAGKGPFPRNFWSPSRETDGSDHTINRGTSRIEDPIRPFEHVHGSGLRAIYDLADLDNARFMIATGQSGHPLSPHYDDLVQPWREGLYVRLTLNDIDIASANGGGMNLVPSGQAPLLPPPAPRLWETDQPRPATPAPAPAAAPLPVAEPAPAEPAEPLPAVVKRPPPEAPFGNPMTSLIARIRSWLAPNDAPPPAAEAPKPETATDDKPEAKSQPSASVELSPAPRPDPPPPRDATQAAPLPADTGLAPIEAGEDEPKK